jgi:hypothetical protein
VASPQHLTPLHKGAIKELMTTSPKDWKIFIKILNLEPVGAGMGVETIAY